MTINGRFINLDRSAERRAQMESELHRVGVDWIERFSAVDGAKLTIPAGCAISAGELACFRSHLEIIETSPPDSFTCILEDDVELSEDLPSFINESQMAGLSEYDLVLIDCQPNWGSVALIRLWQSLSRHLRDPRSLNDWSAPRRVSGVDIMDAATLYCWGTQAYVVTPRGHRSLPVLFRDCLDKGPPGPIDILLAHAMQQGRIKGALLVPFLATPRLASHGQTTIDNAAARGYKLALVSAIRRLLFAGPIAGIEEYARPLITPRADIAPQLHLTGQLMGQAFALHARDGSYVLD